MSQLASRVFLDASVIVAASLSARGGSALIFQLAKSGHVSLLLTEAVVQEAHRSIKTKAGELALNHFYQLLAAHKEAIKLTPTPGELHEFTAVIVDPDDRHVLAAAKKYRATALLTLDRKHFMTDVLRQSSLGFAILTPGEFIRQLRLELEK